MLDKQQEGEGALRRLARVSIIITLIAGFCYQLGSSVQSKLDALPSLTNATRLPDADERIQERTPQEVTLPHYWRDQTREERVTEFVLQFDLATLGLDAQDTFILLPFFEKRATLSLNGTLVLAEQLVAARNGAFSFNQGMVQLTPSLLNPRTNELALRIYSGPGPFAALSPVYFGARGDLVGLLGAIGWFSSDLKILLFGAELLLALYCAIMFYTRPSDTYFGWVAAIMGGSTLVNISIFAKNFSQLVVLDAFLFSLAPLIALAFLGFAFSVAERRVPQKPMLAIGALSLLIFGVGVAGWVNSDRLVFLFSLPVMIVSLGFATFLIATTALAKKVKHIDLLFISLPILAACLVHDGLARFGVIETGTLLMPLGRISSLAGFIVYLMGRAAANAQAVDQASEILRERLALREKQLKDIFEEQQKSREEIAKLGERQRITADLHDGVAGHLVTILSLAEDTNDQHDSIVRTSRFALDELRTVIDTLVVKEADLNTLLASFRERCIAPLERLPIKINWNRSVIDQVIPLTPQEYLNVFRIMQEAVTNAVRHGKPQELTIDISSAHDQITIVITNRDGVTLGKIEHGLGLRSMQSRAQSVRDGKIELASIPGGATLRFSFSV